MRTFQLNHPLSKPLMAGGAVLLSLSLFVDLNTLPLKAWGHKAPVPEACQTVLQPTAKISRQQLAKILAIAEGGKKQQVRDVLKDPYCQLENLQVRAGATAQREAYPLDFEAQVRLIVLYEGDEYVGFRFDFHP
jgi:hypothetical protein